MQKRYKNDIMQSTFLLKRGTKGENEGKAYGFMEKQEKPKQMIKIAKIIGASVALVLMLPGVYLAGIRYVGSKTISSALFGAMALAIVAVFGISLVLNKKGKQIAFLKTITLVLAAGLILANIGTLISPYFIPHTTTTIMNRYYPDTLRYMAQLQESTMGKTVWVDADNDYLDSDSEKDTATDFSNRTAVQYACAEIKTLAPSPGRLTAVQEEWLKAKEGKYALYTINYDKDLKEDREETAYIFTGMPTDGYSDIVFLLSESGDAYWMPMAIYDKMKGETDEQEK